jgi:hypothetical protein
MVDDYRIDVPYDREELAPDWRQRWVGRRRAPPEGPGFRADRQRWDMGLPDWEGSEPSPMFPVAGNTSLGDAPRWQGMLMDDEQGPASRGAVPSARGDATGAVQRAYAYRALNQERDRAQEPLTPQGALQRYGQAAMDTGRGVARGADAAYRQLNHEIRNGPSATELLRETVEPHYYHDMVSAAVDARHRGDIPRWFTYMAAAPVGMAADLSGTLGLGRIGRIGEAGYNVMRRGLTGALGRYGHVTAMAPAFAMPAGQASGLLPGEGTESPVASRSNPDWGPPTTTALPSRRRPPTQPMLMAPEPDQVNPIDTDDRLRFTW